MSSRGGQQQQHIKGCCRDCCCCCRRRYLIYYLMLLLLLLLLSLPNHTVCGHTYIVIAGRPSKTSDPGGLRGGLQTRHHQARTSPESLHSSRTGKLRTNSPRVVKTDGMTNEPTNHNSLDTDESTNQRIIPTASTPAKNIETDEFTNPRIPMT